MRDQIKGSLKEIITEVLNNSIEINSVEDLIIELGMDSIQIIQMIVGIEDKYNIVVIDEDMDIDYLSKFDNVVEMIERYIRSKHVNI